MLGNRLLVAAVVVLAVAAPAAVVQAKDAGCRVMVDLGKELDKLGGGGNLPTKPKALAKIFNDAAAKIKAFEGKAPTQVKNDFVLMRKTMSFAAAIAEKSDPKKPAALSAALKVLDQKPVNDAMNRLDKYAASCGIT